MADYNKKSQKQPLVREKGKNREQQKPLEKIEHKHQPKDRPGCSC